MAPTTRETAREQLDKALDNVEEQTRRPMEVGDGIRLLTQVIGAATRYGVTGIEELARAVADERRGAEARAAEAIELRRRAEARADQSDRDLRRVTRVSLVIVAIAAIGTIGQVVIALVNNHR